MIYFVKYKKILMYLAFIALFIFLDQLSKILAINFFHGLCNDISDYCTYNILPIFSMTYVCNTGVSFGLFQSLANGEIILSILAIVILGLFTKMLLQTKNKYEIIALLLIISGALGNLIDRIKQGCVTDFIHLHYVNYHFPVFNLADCFVSFGAMIIALIEFGKYFNSKKA